MPTNALLQAAPPDVIVNNRGEEYAQEVTGFLQEMAGIVTPMWDSPVQNFGMDQITLAVEKI